MVVKDDVGIKRIRDFYGEIDREFNEDDEIVMDFGDVDRVDLSVVQVVVAAGRRAREEGKTLRLKSVSERVKDQMRICGLKI